MKGDFHVRFRERLGLKCPCLLDKKVKDEKELKDDVEKKVTDFRNFILRVNSLNVLIFHYG
jgi:hypothetical protein